MSSMLTAVPLPRHKNETTIQAGPVARPFSCPIGYMCPEAQSWLMANIASALKAEISRIARKELRAETEALKKTVSRQRADIAQLKRSVQALEKQLRQAARARPLREVRPQEEAGDGTNIRFSAKGLAANRQRLGLSAEDYGLLAGVTGQSIYKYEAGKAAPRAGNLAALVALRKMGKREAITRLEELKARR